MKTNLGHVELKRILRLPAHDVLPFEGISPHPDVQEQRASVLWTIATHRASVVIAPVEAACMRLFDGTPAETSHFKPSELLHRRS